MMFFEVAALLFAQLFPPGVFVHILHENPEFHGAPFFGGL